MSAGLPEPHVTGHLNYQPSRHVMAVKRMDNVGIVPEDIDAAIGSMFTVEDLDETRFKSAES